MNTCFPRAGQIYTLADNQSEFVCGDTACSGAEKSIPVMPYLSSALIGLWHFLCISEEILCKWKVQKEFCMKYTILWEFKIDILEDHFEMW